MWKDDNDSIEKLWYQFIAKSSRYPSVCPICGKKSAHIYLHRFKDNKGSVWIWCSECKNCSHGTMVIPKWWCDDDFIDLTKTASHPDYLENEKKWIDNYVNEILNSIQAL